MQPWAIDGLAAEAPKSMGHTDIAFSDSLSREVVHVSAMTGYISALTPDD